MQLEYSQVEIESSHSYSKPHEEAGYQLHGGFNESGQYISPRMLGRGPAVKNWQKALKERGWDLIDADTRLLTKPYFPGYDQQVLLLKSGLGHTMWNNLTITGVIEGRGRLLMEIVAPDFQKIIEEDISQTSLSHLNKGLLRAHGMDEGGDPDSPLGGHDEMWYAVRDMVFGKNAYPIPEIPESISRPDSHIPLIPQIPIEYENLLMLLMNVLMIEVRAENNFSLNMKLLRNPELFVDRRETAELAADIVQRIREDEQIHVDYLRTAISELRSFTIRTIDGRKVPGKDLIDPAWEAMVRWHAEENPDLQKEARMPFLEAEILKHENGKQILKSFHELDI